MRKILFGFLGLILLCSVSSAVQLGQGLGDIFSIGTCSIDTTGNFRTSGFVSAEGGTYLANYYASLATSNISGSDIASYSAANIVVAKAGTYLINAQTMGVSTFAGWDLGLQIRTGNATYGSATTRVAIDNQWGSGLTGTISTSWLGTLSAGDTVHLGIACTNGGSNRVLRGDDAQAGATSISAIRVQ
jgi:hypothetical protein